jgi:hypothetical protein
VPGIAAARFSSEYVEDVYLLPGSLRPNYADDYLSGASRSFLSAGCWRNCRTFIARRVTSHSSPVEEQTKPKINPGIKTVMTYTPTQFLSLSATIY